jgi:hypothetical protein
LCCGQCVSLRNRGIANLRKMLRTDVLCRHYLIHTSAV